ncbi:SWR1-complex protein 3 [Ranunculus cassubicifolius]
MENLFDIPEELINLIASKLSDIDDIVRFGAICKSTQSCVKQDKRSFVPWLMLAESDNEEFQRKFYDLGSKKVFNIYFPELQGRKCLGSPFGWLLTIGIDLNINLVNPISRVQIALPPQQAFQDQIDKFANPELIRRMFITKVCYSTNPCSSDLIVMVIYSSYQKLAITTPNSTSWTTLKTPFGAFFDLVFFNGLFYAVNASGILMICDITTFEATEFALPPDGVCHGSDSYYLVEMFGDLHLIARTFDADDVDDNEEYAFRYKTVRFAVYKLDLHTREWMAVNNLGDYSLFLGTNSSFAISTSESPGLKGNCIYYTDDRTECYMNSGGRDMGVQDFEKETFDTIYLGSNSRSLFCPPLFIKPCLS